MVCPSLARCERGRTQTTHCQDLSAPRRRSHSCRNHSISLSKRLLSWRHQSLSASCLVSLSKSAFFSCRWHRISADTALRIEKRGLCRIVIDLDLARVEKSPAGRFRNCAGRC